MKLTQRTPLMERPFPDYPPLEEKLNSWSHLFGVLCAVVMLALSIRVSIGKPSIYMVCSVVYVSSVLLTMLGSGIYHGLPKGKAKQVMRVVDHCDIFVTIAGTYTPITLLGICSVNPVMGKVIFAIEWGLALIGVVLNAIDLKRYSVFSMACYLGMGWCVIISLWPAIQAMTLAGFLWIIGGGVAFTIGAVLYLIGKKKRYRHFLFHVFVLLGLILQFVGVYGYLLY
jgi:hemolysin III